MGTIHTATIPWTINVSTRTQSTQLQSRKLSMSQLGHNPQGYNPVNYHTTTTGRDLVSYGCSSYQCQFSRHNLRGVFRWGAIGDEPPPGPVKSIDFKGCSCPNGCWQPPSKEKNLRPPGQILEYAPAQSSSPLFRTRTRLLSHSNQYGVSIPTSVFELYMLQEKVNRRI